MKRMALDVGDKRIGIAIGETVALGAWPQKTLVRKNLEQDLAELLQRIREQEIEQLIVGLPYHMDGREGSQAKKIKTLMTQLEKCLLQEALKVEIIYHDERLTSWEAESRLTEQGFKGKKRKERVDEVAACLILEDFLAKG